MRGKKRIGLLFLLIAVVVGGGGLLLAQKTLREQCDKTFTVYGDSSTEDLAK
ncbi:hypothetical protein MZ16F85_18310 [Escherichia coli]